MQAITIACPACRRSEDVREDDVPAGAVDIDCPHCQAAFTFTRQTVVAPPRPSAATGPPAPQLARPTPPKPNPGRPLSPPRTKTPPHRRSRRSASAVIGAVVLGAMLVGGAWMHVFKLAPIAAEKLLIAALSSRVPVLQRVAIKALRDYPTKHAAIALVAFINLKNMQEAEDPGRPWTPEEKVRKQKQRQRDLKLAERATETLCLLTGQSFGTAFKLEQYGHAWGSLSEDKWPTVLWQIDGWAVNTFAAGDLPVLPGFFGAVPRSASAPGGG